MRDFHLPGRSPVHATEAMAATPQPAGDGDGDRGHAARRQRDGRRDRGGRRAGRGRAASRPASAAIASCSTRRRGKTRLSASTAPAARRWGVLRMVARARHHRDPAVQPACGHRSLRGRRLGAADCRLRQEGAGRAAGAGGPLCRARLSGPWPLRGRLGARCRASPARSRDAARYSFRRGARPPGEVIRNPQLAATLAQGRQGRPRRLLSRRGRRGHGRLSAAAAAGCTGSRISPTTARAM